MIEFISFIFFATLLKLSSSVDDAVWLAKLISKETKTYKKIIEFTYLLSLLIVTALSYLIYLASREALSYISDIYEFLPIVSSVILIIFSVTYLRKESEALEHSNREKGKTLKEKILIAFTVSFIGSIDELLLFITVLSTGKVTIVPLIVGTAIAGIIIIIIVSGLTKATLLMNILNKIPVWLVILTVGLITLLSSLNSIWGNF